MRETRSIEFKETITNTFLKTVSAYANYDGGIIYFGIDDDGKVKGIKDIKSACLNIENKINDSITPQIEYFIDIENNNSTIKLTIEAGNQKPYLYKSKAYKRNDSSTIEVDNIELSRLILEGKNISYEEVISKNQNLTFNSLEDKLKEYLHVNELNKDILKTLNLYSDENGYNNAAALLSDRNDYPGVDIVKFGDNINIIKKREIYENISILNLLEKSIMIFRDYYTYEEIDGIERKVVELIPEDAFREAIANAIIHRIWDNNIQIKISMYDDYIEIISPGGLPTGINKEEYLLGKLSVLRNRIIANVFYRLKLVEIFGTGILRIKHLYNESAIKPKFNVYENSVSIILPVLEKNLNFSEDELIIYNVLSKTMSMPISEIVSNVPFGKSKVSKILKEMINRNIIEVIGEGRGTKYKRL